MAARQYLVREIGTLTIAIIRSEVGLGIIPAYTQCMEATVDGVKIFYLPVGAEGNHPLLVLHGGPGLDHTELHPWLDPLGDTFSLLYLDLRGHGRSERVDPATLTLSRYARDLTQLAAELGLTNYAVLGHSYGAFVTLAHAIEEGGASHYVISSGSASMSKSMVEIQNNLTTFEPVELREQVADSWARELTAHTPEDVAELLRMQLPFHFRSVDSDAFRRYTSQEDRGVYSAEILAYTSEHGYAMEFEDQLGSIRKPTLILVGEHDRVTTARAAREMHEGIPESEMVVFPQSAHMTYIEESEAYFAAVRDFFRRHPSGQRE